MSIAGIVDESAENSCQTDADCIALHGEGATCDGSCLSVSDFAIITTTNNFGIPEPNMSKKVEKPDIIFIPIVAFDNYKNRLGYGGGFYDRYLERIEKKKKVIKIGCAFSFQKINKLPLEDYDKKLDFIITEKKIIL